MHPLPTEPVSPQEFVEDVIPAIFAAMTLDAEADALDVKIGVRIEPGGEGQGGPGEGEGGSWTLHFVESELGISAGLDSDCLLTIRQSYRDWRAALWEGHPSLVSDAIRGLGSEGNRDAAWMGDGAWAPANPMAFHDFAALSGRIDAIVEGRDDSDWLLVVQLGPGRISDSPDATLRISRDDADAIRRGEVHPLEALIAGQLRLEGDLSLIVQIQTVALAASLPEVPPPAE